MTSCDSCETIIISGGVELGELRFCNEECAANYFASQAEQEIPDEIAWQQALEMANGNCPICLEAGPVGIHKAHGIWSVFIHTSVYSYELLGCASCGLRFKLKHMLAALILGWWGFPAGVLITPIQLLRTLYELTRTLPDKPGTDLIELSRTYLVEEIQLRADGVIDNPKPELKKYREMMMDKESISN